MFKYGSFRYFLLKLTLGMILSSISIIMLISLVSYNSADPGFSSYLEGEGVETVSNYLGYIGAYISSFMIVLFGHIINKRFFRDAEGEDRPRREGTG